MSFWKEVKEEWSWREIVNSWPDFVAIAIAAAVAGPMSQRGFIVYALIFLVVFLTSKFIIKSMVRLPKKD